MRISFLRAEIESVCELASLSAGEFSLGLIQCDSKALRDEALRAATEKLGKRGCRLLHVELAGPLEGEESALDQIQEGVGIGAGAQPCDAVVVSGYERWFRHDVLRNRKLLWESRFKEAFRGAVFLCLPEREMAEFLRASPGLRLSVSGYFRFGGEYDPA